MEDIPQIDDKDLLQNADFNEQRESANIKDAIDEIKKTPVSLASFDSFIENVYSQEKIINSHIAMAVHQHKIDNAAFIKAKDDDKGKWLEKQGYTVPSVRYLMCLCEDYGKLVSHEQDWQSLYKAAFERLVNVMKHAKTMDTSREVLQLVSKINEDHNKLLKETVTERSKLENVHMQHIFERFEKSVEMMNNTYNAQFKVTNQQQRDSFEKIFHIMLSHKIIDENMLVNEIKKLEFKEKKGKSRFEYAEVDENNEPVIKPDVAPLTKEMVESMKPKTTIPHPDKAAENFTCIKCNPPKTFADKHQLEFHVGYHHPEGDKK